MRSICQRRQKLKRTETFSFRIQPRDRHMPTECIARLRPPTRRGMHVQADVCGLTSANGRAELAGELRLGLQAVRNVTVHSPLAAAGWPLSAEPPAGAHDDATAHCRPGPVRSCDAGDPLHRPDAADLPPASTALRAGICRRRHDCACRPVPIPAERRRRLGRGRNVRHGQVYCGGKDGLQLRGG